MTVGEFLLPLMLKPGQSVHLEEGGAWRAPKTITLRRDDIVKFVSTADMNIVDAEVGMLDFREKHVNVVYRVRKAAAK